MGITIILVGKNLIIEMNLMQKNCMFIIILLLYNISLNRYNCGFIIIFISCCLHLEAHLHKESTNQISCDSH